MKTLRDLRKEAGVSQETLAALLSGIRGNAGYQGPISSIERGEVSPTIKRVADYLAALGYELKLEAKKRGSEPIRLNLDSLMGRSRAKDAGQPPPKSEPMSPPVTPEPVSSDVTHDSLEALLIGILKK